MLYSKISVLLVGFTCDLLEYSQAFKKTKKNTPKQANKQTNTKQQKKFKTTTKKDIDIHVF